MSGGRIYIWVDSRSGPHAHASNHSQINVGKRGGGAPERWHLDGVDYVLIVMLSDTTEMRGGEILVHLDRPRADTLAGLGSGELRDKIWRIPAPPAGYGIFLKGGELFHTVTSVESAREDRLSVVQSFQLLDVFAPDRAHLHSQAEVYGDGYDQANVEFARHRAHRVAGQLEYLLRDVAHWGADATTLASFLQRSGEELASAAAILRGEVSDMKQEAVGAPETRERQNDR